MATQSMSPLDAINLVKSPCEMQAKPPVVMDAHVPVIASTVSYRLADNTCAIDQLPVNSSFKMCNVTNVINNTNQQQQQDSAIHLKAGHLPSGTCSNTKSSGPSDTISPVNKSPNGVYQRDRESPFSSLDEGIDLEDIEECSSKVSKVLFILDMVDHLPCARTFYWTIGFVVDSCCLSDQRLVESLS